MTTIFYLLKLFILEYSQILVSPNTVSRVSPSLEPSLVRELVLHIRACFNELAGSSCLARIIDHSTKQQHYHSIKHMAEEEKKWLQQHSHETNTITYGSFATATYLDGPQEWTFLREDASVRDRDDVEGEVHPGAGSGLKFLSEPELVVQPTSTQRPSRDQHFRTTSVAGTSAAHSTSRSLAGHGATKDASPVGQCFAVGSAVRLGIESVESGNSSVPVTAFVTGQGRDVLRIACVGRKSLDYLDNDGIKHEAIVPALVDQPQKDWTSGELIEQVSFSSRTEAGHGDTFLAVRLRSRTCIFEPQLRREAESGSFNSQSSLAPNLLLILNTSFTGGSMHADIAFDPQNHRRLAIVDLQGNWSVWKVHGRRTATARNLYQARLKVSGRLLPLQNKKQSEGVRSFHDGWHRILWTSSNRKTVDRLLVCNRQRLELFDLHGDSVSRVDIRLDTRKAHSYILDILAGPKVNLCLVLTTHKVLLFDVSKKDWKVERGPACLGAWQHFHSPADMTLRITSVGDGPTVFFAVYAVRARTIKMYGFKLEPDQDNVQVSSLGQIPLALPSNLPCDSWISMMFAICETSASRGHSSDSTSVLQLIVQHEDLSITSTAAQLGQLKQDHIPRSKSASYLSLPPSRGDRLKSQRRVDDSDDESDPGEFIISDEESESIGNPKHEESTEEIVVSASQKYSSKDLSPILALACEAPNDRSALIRPDASDALVHIENFMTDHITSGSMPTAMTLSHVLDHCHKVIDIEADSARVERALHTFSRANKDGIQVSACSKSASKTMLESYEALFSTYVDGLPAGISDRIRVNRERRIRDLTLELRLSHHVLHQAPATGVMPDTGQQESLMSDPMILSDPVLQHEVTNQPLLQTTSASQPQPRPPVRMHLGNDQASKEVTAGSPLSSALSRLATMTTFNNPPTQELLMDETTSTQIASLLRHLPEDAHSDPADYDWQATELTLAVEKAGPTDVPETQAKRRAQRLANVRSRAEARSSSYAGAQKDKATLPLRSPAVTPTVASSGKELGHSGRSGETQPGRGLTMSDGIQQAGSSQDHGADAAVSTQPVRGTFANRTGTSVKAKVKKKKRIAGF